MGFSDKQRAILKFPYTGYDAIIADGAVRSGKTSVMSLSFFLWAMGNFSDKSFAMCGKSVGAVQRNIVTPLLGVKYLREQFDIKYNRADHVIVARRGDRENRLYLFGGKDESSAALIQGITLAGVLLDEVALMPRSFVEQALARCSVEGARLWFSCNPASPKHWFYQEWILGREKHNALYLHFAMTDNPSLSEKTLERYRTMYSGVFYQRYVLGEWVMADGLVYPNFSEEKHTFTDTPFLREDGRPMPGAEFYASCDYGIVNPFAGYVWVLYKGIAYCWREYYYDSREKQRQRTDEEHYAALDALIGDLPIECIVVDPSATSFKETIRRHDKYDVRNANNDVIPGIGTVASLLDAGRLLVHTGCKKLIEEFGLYSWDSEAVEDSVIKEFDHAQDSCRYFCHTIVRREFDWLDWSVRGGKNG